MPSTAGALDSGGGAWVPGKVLVRFHDAVGASARDRIARRAGIVLRDRLPLLRNLWEADAAGNVSHAVGVLDAERGVDYAQPDYVVDDKLDAAPSDPAYWPTDRYFWPARFGNPNACVIDKPGTAAQLSGWPYWPIGVNLTDPAVPLSAGINPLEPADRATEQGGNVAFANYRPIDVLPVWNLLRDGNRLGAEPPNPDQRHSWTAQAIRQLGVAVMDTGIADHPDVAPRVAAEFGTVTRKVGGDYVDEVTEVYTDDRNRNDIARVREEFGAHRPGRTITATDRMLFALDDTNELSTKVWSPKDGGNNVLPSGCDGHGTEVASVVGAQANRIGTVGVGYNVPLIGLRTEMPWDIPPISDQPPAARLQGAVSDWRMWSQSTLDTDSSKIDQLAVVSALRIPVLNMSFSHAMLTRGTDAAGHQHPVILDPVLAEAFAKTLSSGNTLGVTAAGNNGEYYGTGAAAAGYGNVQLPCGLSMIPRLGVWRSPNPRAANVVAKSEFRPEVDWSRLQLLCVAATTSVNSQLWTHSGNGDAAVDLAAPGTNITVATRAGADPAMSSYTNVNGTSFAAPMVAGAASLLRRAAPGAPISVIRQALLNGARDSPALLRSVAYGSLDVACSLRWLYARKRPGWDVVRIDRTEDNAGYADYLDATSGCSRGPQYWTATLAESKAETYAQGREPASQVIAALNLSAAETSSANRWTDLLTQASGATAPGYRPVFPIGPGAFGKPKNPSELTTQVYRLGLLGIGCPDRYAITGVRVSFANLVKPRGWVFPTDEFAPTQRLQLAVMVAKPWYESVLGSSIKVNLRARCEYYPRAGQ